MTSLFGGGIVSGDTVSSPTSSLVSKPSRDRITAPQPPNVSIDNIIENIFRWRVIRIQMTFQIYVHFNLFLYKLF